MAQYNYPKRVLPIYPKFDACQKEKGISDRQLSKNISRILDEEGLPGVCDSFWNNARRYNTSLDLCVAMAAKRILASKKGLHEFIFDNVETRTASTQLIELTPIETIVESECNVANIHPTIQAKMIDFVRNGIRSDINAIAAQYGLTFNECVEIINDLKEG